MRFVLVVLLRVSTKRILITLLRINLNSRKIGWREKTKNINKSRVQSDSIHRMGTRSKRMKFDEWLSLKKLDYISRNEYKCENYSCSSIFSHDAFWWNIHTEPPKTTKTIRDGYKCMEIVFGLRAKLPLNWHCESSGANWDPLDCWTNG